MSLLPQLLLLLLITLNFSANSAISAPLKKKRSIYKTNSFKTNNAYNVNTAILPKTVTIPSGCYQMGSPNSEHFRNTNEAHHRVCIKRFQMAVNEVTVAEFRAFVRSTHYITDAEIDFLVSGCWSYDGTQKKPWNWHSWASWRTPLKGQINDTDPVTCVSFYDINQYITWLNKSSGKTYRLPTEAEWEYAARAGSNGLYFWGNNPALSCRYANTADLGEFKLQKWPETHSCNDGFFFTAPVKHYLPNKFGLHDMLGNVWEWTCSQYKKEYEGQEQHCVNNDAGNSVFIAVRGGGWNAGPTRTRLAYRNWESPWSRIATWGFRLVRVDDYSKRLRY